MLNNIIFPLFFKDSKITAQIYVEVYTSLGAAPGVAFANVDLFSLPPVVPILPNTTAVTVVTEYKKTIDDKLNEIQRNATASTQSLVNILNTVTTLYSGLSANLGMVSDPNAGSAAVNAALTDAIKSMLNAIRNILNNALPGTSAQVANTFSTLGLLVSNPKACDNVTRTYVVDSITKAINASATVSATAAAAGFNALSNVQLSIGKGEDSTARKINDAIKSLASQLIASQDPNQPPSVITTSTFSVAVAKLSAAYLASGIALTVDNRTSVTIPKNGGSSTAKSTDTINIQVVSSQANPYAGSQPSSSSVLSDIVSLSIDAPGLSRGADGQIALSDPITFSITGTFDVSKKHVCQFWDVNTNVWSTKGCVALAVSNNAINCSCTHTTDFSAGVNQSSSAATTVSMFGVLIAVIVALIATL